MKSILGEHKNEFFRKAAKELMLVMFPSRAVKKARVFLN